MNAAKQKSPKRKPEKLRLNARNAHAQELEGKEKEKFFWDDELKGFGLRLRREGEDSRTHRCWVVGYQLKGRYQRFTIADYEKLTAEQARAEAKLIFGKVARGEDPKAERRAQRLGGTHTLLSGINDYLALKELTPNKKTGKKLAPATLRAARLYLLGPYFRALHSAPITDITLADIATRLNAIIRDSGSITARAARAALSTFFTWAMRQGLTDNNPVIGSEDPGPGQSRERVLSDSELAAVWRAADDGSDYGKIIHLLMLTGCRRDEIGGLQWNEVNKDKATITLPAERVKNAHTHTLPLSAMAQRIIGDIEPRAGRDSLFGDRSSAGFTAWSAAKADLDKRLKGKVAAFRLHDLRRTVATVMAESPPDKEHRERRGLGIKPHVVEAVLNHQSGHKAGVAGIYNRATYEPEVRNALAVWAEHLQSIISGGKRKVLSFPQVSA
jgi:integrase